MEIQLAQIVNAGLAGQPENICLQSIDSKQLFNFSQIVGEDITDGDISHPIIKRILDNGQQIQISVDENNNVTLQS
jgi:hypothetical protein